ncbi:response regulator [Flavobacterium macacae]|uniref:Response regulator n=1 Tax=Flavobacterium macacae TaxID=2488993 RepID=A0A3P3WEV8_9FLAO|nr:response regulator [Flavobacterium macacae]RRJ92938.1 response regulator [Flavobacterium macacae]
MTPQKKNIAFVDNDQDETYIFQIALDELEIDYNFHYFKDSISFMDYLNDNSQELPKLIFLNMHLPNKSGLELFQEIRADQNFDFIRTVIYSNSMCEVTISAFKSLGTTDFIVRTPELAEMKNILKRLIVDIESNQTEV